MDCSFCGREIPKGTETIYVTKRGKALYFCSGKCEINMIKLERKARETKWTAEYDEEKAIRVKGAPKAAAPAPEEKKEEAVEEAPAKEVKEKKAKPKPKAKETKKPEKKAKKKK